MKDWNKIEKRTEEITNIFDNTKSDLKNVDGDSTFLGFQIISKYTKNIVQGAGHDIVYSISIDEIIELNVTDEDLIELAKMNWFINDGEGLASFV